MSVGWRRCSPARWACSRLGRLKTGSSHHPQAHRLRGRRRRRGAMLSCPACGKASQPVHDRLRRWWRQLDFFQFEAWRNADVPRVACGGCGKTTQLTVPWARPGSGVTAAFEALALALCRELPVQQAAALLRCSEKQLWRRIESYVEQARTGQLGWRTDHRHR